MSKKILATVALAIAALFAFAGCSGESYNFTALTDNPAVDAEVRSNGGIYVEKGIYSYFVNGNQTSTLSNKFGDEHKAAIVRVKTANLGKEDAVVEVVVPKIVYSAELSSAGFYIYGNKIYYTTPNSTKDANGAVQSGKLDFMSANIDGTGTKLIGTADKNTFPFLFAKNDKGLFVLYFNIDDKKLFEIDGETGKVKEIAKDVATYAFDRTRDSVSYVQTQKKKNAQGVEEDETAFNILYKYVGGADSSIELKTGKAEDSKKQETMTVVNAKDGFTYYNYSISFTKEIGLRKITNDKASDKLLMLTAKGYTTFTPFVEDGKDVIYLVDGGYIQKLVFENGKATSLKLLKISDTITIDDVVGGYVFYNNAGALYRISTTELNQKTVKVTHGTMSDTWARFDYSIIDGKMNVFYFRDDSNENDFTNYMVKDFYNAEATTDEKVENVQIGKLTKADQKIKDEGSN